jgi:hypothetical protein
VAQVPESMWQPIERAQLAGQGRKWLIWFLILTIGLPTCLGLAGALVGVGGGLLAAIISFILSFFVQ